MKEVFFLINKIALRYFTKYNNLDLNLDLINDDIENMVKIKLDSKINQWKPIEYFFILLLFLVI